MHIRVAPGLQRLGLLRLLKTAYTFGDWVPYVLWKLERHTGRTIELSPRQRRHPLIFGWPIILPLLTPFMVSGYAFAFVLSLNEYIIAYMVAGFTVETLPIKIFNSLRYGYTPIMGVVAVIFVALAALTFGLIGRYGNLPRLLGAERIGND